MLVAEAVLLAVSLAALVPAIVLFVELMFGVTTLTRGPAVPSASPAPRIAVLVPAHDEESGITSTLQALLPQLGPGDRVLVVADNCSDATAAIARRLGADVVERFDATRRGKGYALDFGVRSLATAPPDVVVVVDADCIVEAGAVQRLAACCSASGRPMQALYLMRAPVGAPLVTRVSQLAWLVKNRVRPTGAARLGWPCPLMGSGMAFPWRTLERAPLSSGHLVEDMKLGVDLAIAGTPPLFCPEAAVGSTFPSERSAQRSQRTRWEHGHVSIIATAGPRLLLHALVKRDAAAMAMLLDLMVPPLAALLLGLAAWAIVAAVAWRLGAGALPFGVALLALGLPALGLARAWYRVGRQIVRPHEVMALPRYVFAKIPIYVGLLVRRQTQWIRTPRDDRKP